MSITLSQLLLMLAIMALVGLAISSAIMADEGSI